MQSPVLELETAIAASAFRIAPERENELADWRDQADVSISLTDEREFDIRVNVNTKEVTLPIAALEYLWCAAFLFYVCFEEYMRNQHAGAAQFAVGGDARTAQAWNLYLWAKDNVMNSGTEEWPPSLPRPAAAAEDGSDIHLANELFLCAIAWIIHHELAHVRQSHEAFPTENSINQEREADAAAAAWILDQSKVTDEARKRTLGIAIAILAMHMLEKPGPGKGKVIHPRAVERLDACLIQADCPEDDATYALALVAMQVQLAHEGVRTTAPNGESFREMLCELMVSHVQHNSDRASV